MGVNSEEDLLVNVKKIKTAVKDGEWGVADAAYNDLNKTLVKYRVINERDGIPTLYIKCVYDLDQAVQEV